MDKYEYNLKLEEIDKLVDQGDYEEAANLADTIDWKRVRNVRTLCLISEIYEASGRLEDSKRLLVRAYRKSPIGKNILYRLVEVTTALQQYDEAIEYYSEYVQAAPHDNNRYILKYMIYRGRGSSLDEQILILEEYLGQEYTERWAYELAKLYQQAGQMQKCFAACDDLVLWFHSGKYVRKALELKKKYTALTPKQQQIYEDCLIEDEREPEIQPEEEGTVLQSPEEIDEEVLAETIMAETERAIAEEVAARKAELEKAEQNEQEMAVKEPTKDMSAPEALPEKDPTDLKIELAKNMREIISGVVRRNMENEDDIPASVDADVQAIQRLEKLELPEASEPEIGKLSIDDILLSMGEKGKQAAEEALRVQAKEKAAAEAEAKEIAAREAAKQAAAQAAADADLKDAEAKFRERARSMTATVAEDLTDAQKEALQYTNHPEKLLRNRRSLPTYMEEQEDFGATRRISTKEELAEASRQEILSEKTIRIPIEEIAAGKAAVLTEEEPEMKEEVSGEEINEETYDAMSEQDEAEAYEEEFEQDDESAYEDESEQDDEAAYEDESEQDDEAAYEEDLEQDDAEEYEEDYEYLTIPQHLRGLFAGFTEVEGLEDQIANAIIQAEAKGEDRTSRTGNILIFGAHGSGKTTLAMNIAKAVAQDKGSQVMKMAKIYAADLNRKDIAATVARIAGGTLIIEEAGDLEPNTVEQLTTAMEFRTDGLIVILEDEQQYIHELLMRHPRFTMKFTAQIYIPMYTAEELAMFGQIYANQQDYMISEDGLNALYERISESAEMGNQVAISDVIGMVANAIQRSNKFLRKMAMGKKRYDENDYILLFAKDFK